MLISITLWGTRAQSQFGNARVEKVFFFARVVRGKESKKLELWFKWKLKLCGKNTQPKRGSCVGFW